MSARTTWRSRTRGGCSGPSAIIGLSIKTVAQANAAPLDLLDYVGIGGVYATTSKDNPKHADRHRGLCATSSRRSARAAAIFRSCGIAGIDAGNAAAVIAAGADGVAVISALSLRADPEARGARTARHRRCGARSGADA